MDIPPARSAAEDYRVVEWLDPERLGGVEYAEYWNDEEIERAKRCWWVDDGDFARMERYVEESGLLASLNAALDEAERLRGRPLAREGADVAAGSLWAIPHLLAAGTVDRVYAVEYSRHRMLKLGPEVLRHYGVAPDAVRLCVGSFYELALPDRSLDFVLLSQTLHHADRPDRLLEEVRRVLAPDGVVLVIGEPIVRVRFGRWIRQLVKIAAVYVLPRSLQVRIFGHRLEIQGLRPVFPSHPESGDHYWYGSDDARLFEAAGYRATRVPGPRRGYRSSVLWPHRAFVLRRA